MPRPVEFSYWGPPGGATAALERDLERAALLGVLGEAVRQRPGRFWGVALLGYLAAWGLLWWLAPAWIWQGAILLHLIYGPLLSWAAHHIYQRRVLEEARLASLRQWLHQLDEALPKGCSLDLAARLSAGGCRHEEGGCSKPWVQARCALPGGSVLELQVLEGRACSMVRHDVAPGSSRLTLRLCGEDPERLRAVAREVRRLRQRTHDLTHEVLLETPHRLRWSVMLRGGPEHRLPVWPLAHLVPGWRYGAHPEVEPWLGEAAEPQRRADQGAPRRFCLYAPSPTWREIRDQAQENLERALPSAQRVAASGVLALNGLLGLCFLGLGQGHGGAVWGLGLGGALLLGLGSWGQLWWSLSPTNTTQRGPIGEALLGEELLEVSSELQPAQRVDFARPLRAHLARDPKHNMRQGHILVHLSVVQRQGDHVERACVSSWLPWREALVNLPVKEQEAPLMEPAQFHALWEEVRRAISLHTTAPARVLEVQHAHA